MCVILGIAAILPSVSSEKFTEKITETAEDARKLSQTSNDENLRKDQKALEERYGIKEGLWY